MLKIASIAIVSILIVSILTPSALYAADNRQKTNLEKCIEQLKSSISRIEEFIKKRGISLPEDISGNLTKAGTLLGNARSLIGEGKYDEARECLREAMKCIRIVASYVCREVREEIREMVQEKAAIGLKVAIQTHRKFIERLNNTVNSLEEMGITVSDEIKEAINNVRGAINESNETLNETLRMLEEGKINETARLLGESKRIIAGIIGQLNKLVKGRVEGARVAKEIGKHLRRMEEITRDIENEVARRRREEAINHLKEVINKLNESLNKLNQLKKHLWGKGIVIKGIDEAISKMREKIDHVEKIGKGISK